MRLALAAAWSARHPRERFARKPDRKGLSRIYYQTEDGWEAPLWHYPAHPGASGEPIILAHGLGINPRSFDFDAGSSLARALRDAGFSIYLLEHRGDRNAISTGSSTSFDFDDIVTHDVPAALARVRAHSGYERPLWIGHSLGGQLLYAHLARGGRGDLAAGITLCAPVRFAARRSRARAMALASHLLPEGWDVPTRLLNQAIAPIGAPDAWSGLSSDAEGPLVRGVMLHGMANLHTGLLRQITHWVNQGSLCDRHGRFDYIASLRGMDFPIFGISAANDPVCPHAAAKPALDAFSSRDVEHLTLDERWGHLDPLIGRRASEQLFPRIIAWCDERRRECWKERRF